MALQLPANFKKDIEGRDTSLIPVVRLHTGTDFFGADDLFISTNSFTTEYYYTNIDSFTVGTKPLLLNIPSLKESIDLETRKYKISSINLSISNAPFGGMRFSELISSSLINTLVDIYWVSPSTTTLSDAFKIYRGQIRRYDHDDEKVKLIVEDRSQSSLHKDLPLPNTDTQTNWFGEDVNIPEKYKNKPIPIVYGKVDKSPLLRYTKDGKWTLIAHNKSSEVLSIASEEIDEYGIDNYSNLFTFKGDKYLSVAKEDQFSISDEKEIVIASIPVPSGVDYVDENNFVISDPVDFLTHSLFFRPTTMKLLEDAPPWNVLYYDITNYDESTTSLLEGINTSALFDGDLSTSLVFDNIQTDYPAPSFICLLYTSDAADE